MPKSSVPVWKKSMLSQNRHVEFDGNSSGISRPARNAFA
jgi:hypothetical protein